MSLNPQIALFAALLAALGGPVKAGSPEETEACELRKARTGIQQLVNEPLEPSSPGWAYELEFIDTI